MIIGAPDLATSFNRPHGFGNLKKWGQTRIGPYGPFAPNQAEPAERLLFAQKGSRLEVRGVRDEGLGFGD